MCSWIPKPKFPVSEKFSRLNSYSRTYMIKYFHYTYQTITEYKTKYWINRPLIHVPRFLQPWHHELCSERQFFHFFWYWTIWLCNGLWRKLAVDQLTVPIPGRWLKNIFNCSYLWLEQLSHTLAARVSLSPDSPTQMFKHNLRILNSRIRFLDFSDEDLVLSPFWKTKIKCKYILKI